MKTISIAAVIAACLIGHTIAAPVPAPDVMLFSYFRDNGKDGVFLATSEDGAEFKALNDDKLWWFVWDEPAGGHLQLATSPDLKTWTHRKDTKFPPRAQHGTLFLAPKSAVAWIKP
jgi:hypothetical protein